MMQLNGLPPIYADDVISQNWEAADAERLYLRHRYRSLLPVAVVFVVLNALDWLSTNLVLRTGRGVEGNPLARLYVGSMLLFLAVKFLYAPTLAWKVAQHRDDKPKERASGRGLIIWTGLFGVVVAWNFYVYLTR